MNPEETVIGRNSGITIALLGGILFVSIIATWGAAWWASSVDNRLANIEANLEAGTCHCPTRSD